ncbi:MAG: hypothetical protein WAZ18_07295 [Alphaproteobacteria bacterium]
MPYPSGEVQVWKVGHRWQYFYPKSPCMAGVLRGGRVQLESSDKPTQQEAAHMKNGMVLLAVALSVTSFAGMLRLKTDVEQRVRERSALVKHRADLTEEKLILEAELAFLAQPKRLQAFAEKRGYVELDMVNIQTLQPLHPKPLVTEGGVDAVVE